MSKPYARRWYRGVLLDNRTISALEWAEKRYREVAPRKREPFRYAQGSYNAGRVGASAGTHDGGGAVDLGAAHLNPKQIRGAVRWLRRAGFAASFRPEYWRNGKRVWGPHIHAILLGHNNASDGAKRQMQAYLAGRDGLAGNGPDKDWRPKWRWRWNHKKNRRVRKGRL